MKRNLIYETRCITCEDSARHESEDSEIVENEKNEKKRKLNYINTLEKPREARLNVDGSIAMIWHSSTQRATC